MKELNPNHRTTRTVHDHWHKVAAMLLWKLSRHEPVVFTIAEIQEADNAGINIVIKDADNRLTVYLVDDVEAERLAREEGGLPV